MSFTEIVWLVVSFSVLPIAVLAIGFVLLWCRSPMKLWRNYAWLLGAAVIAWCGLVLLQSSFELSAGTDAEEVVPAIAYYLGPVFSLGGIVIGGSFWYLVGRAAALERESSPEKHVST